MAVMYYELVIKGNGKLLRGFVRGYEIGKSIKNGLFFSQDRPIATHHLKETLTFRGDHLHLLCGARIRQGFLAALRQAEDLDFEIIADRRVVRSSFEFEFETASRKVASDIKRRFRSIPAGLKLVGYEPIETVDPSAKGVEIYTPVHDYRFEGNGVIEGDLETLLACHERLTTNEFIEAEDIAIEV